MFILKTLIKNNLFLIIIVLTFFIVKLSSISFLPLFNDEMDVGNQTFSLSNNLRDYRGNFLPTYLDSFSESRAPLLMYLSIPFVKFLGLNPISVRLPSIIFACLSLIYFYLLVSKLTTKSIGLFSTFILSTSIAFFHYSGLAFETSLLILLIISTTYYFYLKKYFLSLFLFSLTFYTYNIANIFVPLLVIFLFVSNYQSIDKRKFFLSSLLPIILCLPLLFQIVTGSASNRFSLISIFNQNQKDSIEIKRSSATNPYSIPEKIFHNRFQSTFNTFLNNYISSFSGDFIFLKGDPNPRHSVPSFGLFLAPLFLIIPFCFFSKNASNKLFIFWLIISPIAASLTQNGGNHLTRLFPLIIPLSFFFGCALDFIFLKFKIIFIVFCLFFIYSCFSFYHEYQTHYLTNQYQSWGYGYQQLFSNLPNHQRLFVSNLNYDLVTPFVFYQKHSNQILNDQSTENIFQDFSGFKINSTYFITNWKGNTLDQIKNFAQPNDLFILKQLKDIPGDMDLANFDGFKLINQIKDPHQTLLYQVILKE